MSRRSPPSFQFTCVGSKMKVSVPLIIKCANQRSLNAQDKSYNILCRIKSTLLCHVCVVWRTLAALAVPLIHFFSARGCFSIAESLCCFILEVGEMLLCCFRCCSSVFYVATGNNRYPKDASQQRNKKVTLQYFNQGKRHLCCLMQFQASVVSVIFLEIIQ